MPIVLVRIDDRLIHGQVVVGWAQALRETHIVVI
ncbi:MAG TPA: PTS sugar transporter subunit IIB, partial [Candidatus Goldiibacteriota bacterium]|nr:PTS sugar transporter subunit IIB [Candidatus Goldiibacteriota bacterium]